MARSEEHCMFQKRSNLKNRCAFKSRPASALVIVLGMTAVISIITIGWWHRASLSFDIVVTRERYYKNFYMTDRVLSFGVAVAKKRFSEKFSCIEVDCSGIDTSNAWATCLITRPSKKLNNSTFVRVLATLYRSGGPHTSVPHECVPHTSVPHECVPCFRLCCTLYRTSVLRKKGRRFHVESSFMVTNYTII